MLLSKKYFIISIFLLNLGISYSFAQIGSEHRGKVLEALNQGSYTYVNVEENKEKFWLAVPVTPVEKGDTISFKEQMWQYNFKSKSLKRTFDKILFTGSIKIETYAPDVKIKPDENTNPAEYAGIFTVAQLFDKKKELAGKSVTVKGKAVKVSEGIMKRNWIHIQDGTGKKGSNDIIFTSPDQSVKKGEKVTATGVVVLDKDFGSGYFYTIIIEKSSFKK